MGRKRKDWDTLYLTRQPKGPTIGEIYHRSLAAAGMLLDKIRREGGVQSSVLRDPVMRGALAHLESTGEVRATGMDGEGGIMFVEVAPHEREAWLAAKREDEARQLEVHLARRAAKAAELAEKPKWLQAPEEGQLGWEEGEKTQDPS